MESNIEWEGMKQNQDLSITLIEEDKEYLLTVKIIEIEWTPNRLPFIADLEIVETDDAERWYEGMVLRLPIHTSEKMKFLVKAPKPCQPNREFSREAQIIINN
jgi:hypothetical protein